MRMRKILPHAQYQSPSLDMRLVSVDSVHLALGGHAFGEYHTHTSILLLNSDVFNCHASSFRSLIITNGSCSLILGWTLPTQGKGNG